MPEWVSAQTEQDQEGAQKESRGDRREGILALAEEPGASRENEGVSCLLKFKVASDWVWKRNPRLCSTALSSRVTLDFIVKRESCTGRREKDTCSYFLRTHPAWQMALAEWSLTLTQQPVCAPLTEVTYVSFSSQLLAEKKNCMLIHSFCCTVCLECDWMNVQNE